MPGYNETFLKMIIPGKKKKKTSSKENKWVREKEVNSLNNK